MSKVLTEDTASSTEQITEQGPTYEQRVDGLSPAARAHWQQTGDLDEAEKLEPKPDDKPDSSPEVKEPADAPAQTEPASGPGEPEDKQPKTRQDRNFANLRKERDRLDRELIAAQAKLELLERERAGNRPSAPVTEEKAKPTDSAKPKRPRLSDHETVEAYEAAMDAYEEAREQYQSQQLEIRERESQTRQSESQRMTTWTEQVERGKAELKDFEQVAFSPDVPASFTSIPRLMARKDGYKIAYHLGTHPEDAATIAELTDIPGVRTAEEYAAFVKRAETDPQAARQLARAETLADYAFDQIANSLGKPAAPKTTPRPKPTSEVAVNPRGSAVTDELEDALARQDYVAYERIMNRRDIEARKGG